MGRGQCKLLQHLTRILVRQQSDLLALTFNQLLSMYFVLSFMFVVQLNIKSFVNVNRFHSFQ